MRDKCRCNNESDSQPCHHTMPALRLHDSNAAEVSSSSSITLPNGSSCTFSQWAVHEASGDSAGVAASGTICQAIGRHIDVVPMCEGSSVRATRSRVCPMGTAPSCILVRLRSRPTSTQTG